MRLGCYKIKNLMVKNVEQIIKDRAEISSLGCVIKYIFGLY